MTESPAGDRNRGLYPRAGASWDPRSAAALDVSRAKGSDVDYVEEREGEDHERGDDANVTDGW